MNVAWEINENLKTNMMVDVQICEVTKDILPCYFPFCENDLACKKNTVVPKLVNEPKYQGKIKRNGKLYTTRLCDDEDEAVNETKGKFILYDNKPINALFHSNSGGKTELAINVWGGDFPYFQTVETSGENEYTSYNSEMEISKDTLVQKMIENYPNFKIDFSKEDCIKILELTDSNRVKQIKIGNTQISGVEARKIFELKSANFNFEISKDTVKFNCFGYGHGVGLSQCGSDVLAKQGKTYEEIIKHYYKNVEISE